MWGYIKHLNNWPKWKLFLSSSELQSHMYFCCTIYHRITEFIHAVASYRLESLIKPIYWVRVWQPLGICLVCLVDVICFLVRWRVYCFRWSRVCHKYQSTLAARLAFSRTGCEFISVCAKECLQRCLGPLPCIFTSCCLSGSYEIFLNVLPSQFVSFTKCLSNIDSLPQWGLNAADGCFVSQLWFMQLLLLPKSFFVYPLHPLTSALCWEQGLLNGCSWGITYPLLDFISWCCCRAFHLWSPGLSPVF